MKRVIPAAAVLLLAGCGAKSRYTEPPPLVELGMTWSPDTARAGDTLKFALGEQYDKPLLVYTLLGGMLKFTNGVVPFDRVESGWRVQLYVPEGVVLVRFRAQDRTGLPLWPHVSSQTIAVVDGKGKHVRWADFRFAMKLLDDPVQSEDPKRETDTVAQAKAALQEEIEHYPDNLPATLALALLESGRKADSAYGLAVKAALATKPADPDAQHALINACLRLGWTAKAESLAEVYLEKHGKSHTGASDVALAMAALPKPENAQEDPLPKLKAAMLEYSVTPATRGAPLEVAILSYQRGDIKGAKYWLEKAAQFNPSSPVPLYYLAMVATKASPAQFDTAKYYLERAEELFSEISYLKRHPWKSLDYTENLWNAERLEYSRVGSEFYAAMGDTTEAIATLEAGVAPVGWWNAEPVHLLALASLYAAAGQEAKKLQTWALAVQLGQPNAQTFIKSWYVSKHEPPKGYKAFYDSLVATLPLPPSPGKPLVGVDLQGERAAAGKGTVSEGPTVVAFWGTWCGPCRVEIPHLNKLVESYKGKGVRFVAATDEPAEKVVSFLEGLPFAYEHITQADESFSSWNVNAVPMHIILDKRGDVVFKRLGGGPDIGNELARRLDYLLGEEEK